MTTKLNFPERTREIGSPITLWELAMQQCSIVGIIAIAALAVHESSHEASAAVDIYAVAA
jgi:hypothetical protein